MVDVVEFFCEDRGHEQFGAALIKRLADECRVPIDLRVRSARGGRGRAMTEFRAWQAALGKGLAAGSPDLLVLVIDGNCEGWNSAHQALATAVDGKVFPRTAIGTPDPHIERWCFADATAFQSVIGISPPADPGKCDRGVYKGALKECILAAEQPIVTDAMEWAPELVAAADLYAAGKVQPSLGSFVAELRRELTGLASRLGSSLPPRSLTTTDTPAAAPRARRVRPSRREPG